MKLFEKIFSRPTEGDPVSPWHALVAKVEKQELPLPVVEVNPVIHLRSGECGHASVASAYRCALGRTSEFRVRHRVEVRDDGTFGVVPSDWRPA